MIRGFLTQSDMLEMRWWFGLMTRMAPDSPLLCNFLPIPPTSNSTHQCPLSLITTLSTNVTIEPLQPATHHTTLHCGHLHCCLTHLQQSSTPPITFIIIHPHPAVTPEQHDTPFTCNHSLPLLGTLGSNPSDRKEGEDG